MFRLMFYYHHHDVRSILCITVGTGRDLRQTLQLYYLLLFYSWDRPDDGYKATAETYSWFVK